ncbi:putative NCS1 family transporter [Arthrobacter globiformis NBRC 12137]|uniref:Putative NCS1 family transporter n=1 Tax=Arthrobacter globiformis (strain ATCC 8010 / DSM 20124 / JCM 1332 / NBRC 12137 / NCIMB 8907 / NRRL B-2979 / 168) TaxID=1077972 RepID=H0QK56_ARTG1|nr:cytosine permease [Arthrobacter globiformis]GAB13296.1 putative NCS1 family transporter [Arthrobacter globiformis NBRC 12137]
MPTPAGASPRILKVEQHGVEPIPATERTATAFDLFRLIFGGANTFVTVILGSVPILFGLSFIDALWVTITGVMLGALVVAPMALFGPVTGSNNAVSSSGHFGAHGRIIGSCLALLVAVAFYSISVWTSGDVILGAAHQFFAVPSNPWTLGAAYGILAVLMLVVCIYGFRFMLWVNKVAIVGATIMFLAGILAFADKFDFGYAGAFGINGLMSTDPAFWAAAIGAGLVVMSNPVSFATFLGDWTRYIPKETPRKKLMSAVVLANIATLLPFIFGLATTSIIASAAPSFFEAGDYVGGLLSVSPLWYCVPISILAVIGGMSTGTGLLYGTGLDFASIVPRLSRVQSTILIGAASLAFILFGKFVLNVVQSISTFAILIVTCTAPWMVIMIVGFVKRKGWYDQDDLQVFNRRVKGGIYWFNDGWNWRAVAVWALASATGLVFVNVPGQFVGWLSPLVAGVDISIPVAAGLAAVLYMAVLARFPEPSFVYGAGIPLPAADPVPAPASVPSSLQAPGTPPDFTTSNTRIKQKAAQ